MQDLLQPNIQKIVEAVLQIVCHAQRLGTDVTQYDIVKTLFLADTGHLNEYGRPITFDNYVAMEHGPVPTTSYDLVKENYAGLPWKRIPGDNPRSKAFFFVQPSREPNEDVLSPSDVAALNVALERVKQLGFSGARALTHEHPAYLDAWNTDSDRKSFPMDYGKLLDTPDPEIAAELAFLSKHI